MKLTLRADVLAEALALTIPFAGTDKMLPSLVTVRIIPTDDGVAFVSTDRYALSEYRATGDDVHLDNPVPEGIGVPLDTAKHWLKMVKAARRFNPQQAQIVLDERTVTLTVGGQSITDAAEDSTWVPNYARLFPENPGQAEVGMIGLRTDNLDKLVKALPKKTPVYFAFNGPAKSVTATSPHFDTWRALIMPVRIQD